MKYKILSHTADLRLEIFGNTLEELFKNAAEALARVFYSRSESAEFNIPAKVEESAVEKIKIQSVDLNALLIDFLSEILTKTEIRRKIYKVKDLKLNEKQLEAELVGFPIGHFDEDVKAVTYHEVDIKQDEKGIWKTKLVLDI